MQEFDNIARFSHLPIVNLRNPGLPRDGVLMRLTDTCRANFAKGDACRRHYEGLAGQNYDAKELVQCPFGFASVEFKAGDAFAALTGFVPNPRLGGPTEARQAKKHREARVNASAVEEVIYTLKDLGRRLKAIDDEASRRLCSVEDEVSRRLAEVEVQTAKKFSMALHEIRKLNRTVVQTAERQCINERPQAPELADSANVTIWKTAELMSKQFDVIEILANESLTTLPVKAHSILYKIFDKCVRVYKVQPGGKRIFLQAPYGYEPKILVCEKTFPIIPTALISNALKYSMPDSEIRVILSPDGEYCEAAVISQSAGQQILDDSVFRLGVRASEDKEGSGMGLYVAQLVARQHRTEITVESSPASNNTVKHIFRVRFRTIR